MFVLITTRVVKINTGAEKKFAPRSANQTRLTVSGPFSSLKAAQRASLVALGVHTCLDAQVWSESQVREKFFKGYGGNGEEWQTAMTTAMRLIEAAK